MLTGYVNLAYKHSIPKQFDTKNLSFISSSWTYYDAKAMIPISDTNGTSHTIVISDG